MSISRQGTISPYYSEMLHLSDCHITFRTGVVDLEKEKVREIIKNLSEKFPYLEIIIVNK